MAEIGVNVRNHQKEIGFTEKPSKSHCYHPKSKEQGDGGVKRNHHGLGDWMEGPPQVKAQGGSSRHIFN